MSDLTEPVKSHKVSKLYIMAIFNNILTSVILAPIVTILSALSLSTLQRGLDYITSIAKNPQKGSFIKNNHNHH